MSKIENTVIYGLDRVFKTAKYPKAVDINKLNNDLTKGIEACLTCHTGEGHDNALKGIVVQFDLTLPIKAWVEAERYHWLDFVSSQSTMHKIAKFDIKAQCNKYVDERAIAILEEKKAKYLETNDPEDYLALLYNIPDGFELTAGMTTNYQQLKTIYQQRRTHRLPDWQMFCDWIESLPHSELITKKETKVPIDENFETILTCAIRYAIGRQTYMPHLVIDYIAPLLPILSNKALSVMKNDVATAEHYGNDMIDKPAWMEFYAKVLNEIERR